MFFEATVSYNDVAPAALAKNFQVPIRMHLIINSRDLGTFSSCRQRRLFG
jgi:hypothetical protein